MTTADWIGYPYGPCFILTAIDATADTMMATLGPGSPAPGHSLVLHRIPADPGHDLYRAEGQPANGRALDFASTLTWLLEAGEQTAYPMSLIPRVHPERMVR